MVHFVRTNRILEAEERKANVVVRMIQDGQDGIEYEMSQNSGGVNTSETCESS